MCHQMIAVFVLLITKATESFQHTLIKIPVYHDVGVGNTLKSLISALSVNPNTKIESADFPTGNYASVLEKRFIYNSSDNALFRIVEYTCWRWRVLREEEASQTTLVNDFSSLFFMECDMGLTNYFSMRVRIDLYYNRALIADSVYSRITKTIDRLVFKDIILSEVAKFKFTPGNTLAVSVRTWKAPHEKSVDRRYSFDEYANAITMMLQQNTNIDTIVLSVDSDDAFSDYLTFLQRFQDVVVIPLFYRVDFADELNYLQRAVVKMLAMSKCAYFICNRISTYSELVFWFSGCKQKVVALM